MATSELLAGLNEQQIAAIRATRLPTVGVFGNDGANGTGLNHLLNTYNYGVQVTWPLFEGGQLSVPIAETFALEDAAAAYERFAAGGKLGKIVLTI